MTQSWGQTNVIIPPCPCRWATHRVPTRVVRSLAWAGRYTTPSTALKAQRPTGLQQLLEMAQAQGNPQSVLPTTRRRQATKTPMRAISPHHCPIWVLGLSVIFVLFFYMSECCQLRLWGKGVKAISRCMWGGGPHQGSSRHQVSQQTLGQAVRGKKKPRQGGELAPSGFRLHLPCFSFLCRSVCGFCTHRSFRQF